MTASSEGPAPAATTGRSAARSAASPRGGEQREVVQEVADQAAAEHDQGHAVAPPGAQRQLEGLAERAVALRGGPPAPRERGLADPPEPAGTERLQAGDGSQLVGRAHHAEARIRGQSPRGREAHHPLVDLHAEHGALGGQAREQLGETVPEADRRHVDEGARFERHGRGAADGRSDRVVGCVEGDPPQEEGRALVGDDDAGALPVHQLPLSEG